MPWLRITSLRQIQATVKSGCSTSTRRYCASASAEPARVAIDFGQSATPLETAECRVIADGHLPARRPFEQLPQTGFGRGKFAAFLEQLPLVKTEFGVVGVNGTPGPGERECLIPVTQVAETADHQDVAFADDRQRRRGDLEESPQDRQCLLGVAHQVPGPAQMKQRHRVVGVLGVLCLQQAKVPVELAPALDRVLIAVVVDRHVGRPRHAPETLDRRQDLLVNAALPADLRMAAEQADMLDLGGRAGLA